MGAEREDRKKAFFRKPAAYLRNVTVLVIIYAVWCLLLVILTASGHLLNSQSFEYTNNQTEVSRLREEANLVYMWSGLSLPVCLLVLLEFWRKKGCYFKMLCGTTLVLFVFMIVTFYIRWKKETQEIKLFENRYLALLPLRDPTGFTQDQMSNATYHQHNNVHLWQVEFKCCGLQSYQDWDPSIPDSCLCDGAINSSDCAAVGITLVYEKPCLPTVLSLAEKRSITFWIIMIVWMIIVSVPCAISVLLLFLVLYIYCDVLCEPCVDAVNERIYKMRGGEEMVPVVFIRNSNNNQTEEEHGKDGEAEENSKGDDVVVGVDSGTNADKQEAVEVKGDENSVTIIPLSLLRRLEEELDPPPVQHQVWCLCIITQKVRSFYTILIEEDSPLLPTGAVLADANKPSKDCFWAEGHHIFSVENIIWPK